MQGEERGVVQVVVVVVDVVVDVRNRSGVTVTVPTQSNAPFSRGRVVNDPTAKGMKNMSTSPHKNDPLLSPCPCPRERSSPSYGSAS